MDEMENEKKLKSAEVTRKCFFLLPSATHSLSRNMLCMFFLPLNCTHQSVISCSTIVAAFSFLSLLSPAESFSFLLFYTFKAQDTQVRSHNSIRFCCTTVLSSHEYTQRNRQFFFLLCCVFVFILRCCFFERKQKNQLCSMLNAQSAVCRLVIKYEKCKRAQRSD